MSVAKGTSTNPEKTALDSAKPETIADHLRLLKLGKLMRGQFPQVLRRMVPALDSGAPASAVLTIVLPDDGKASMITRAYARAATSAAGELTPDGGAYAQPSSGHIAIQPNGDLALLGTDAATDVDVHYLPVRGDVVQLAPLAVASNSMALPSFVTTSPGGVVLLLEAISLVGTTTGKLRVGKPQATSVGAGIANLDVAKTHVLFNSGDAVTSAQVKLLVCAADDLSTLLEADATIQ